MTVTYLGSLSIGGSIPGAEAAVNAGISGMGLQLPDLTDQLTALLAIVPTPVDFTAQIKLCEAMVASVTAAMTLGLPVPDITAALAAAISALQGLVGGINAQLSICADFNELLLAAGVHGYVYAGPVGALGPELTAELAGGAPGGTPADPSNAIVLLTTVPATWAAMSQVFKVTP